MFKKLLQRKLRLAVKAIACCAVLVQLSPVPADANELQVVTEILPPYQTQSEDGAVGGMATEIVRALLGEAQLQASIQVLPWARAYRTALKRPNTMIFSMARTSAREDKFHWIGSIDKEDIYYWSLARHEARLGAIDKRDKSIVIGVMRDSNVEQYLKSNGHANYHSITNENQALMMLHLGHVDLMIEAEMTFAIRLQSHDLDRQDFTRLEQVKPLSTDLYIAMSEDSDPELVVQLQDAYKELKSNGELDCIREKWKSLEWVKGPQKGNQDK